MKRTICYYGSERRAKVIPALEEYYNVCDISNPQYNLKQARGLLKSTKPDVLITDSPYHGILAYLSRRLGIPYIVRLRGGMWREQRDKDEWNFIAKALKYKIRDIVLRHAIGIIPVSRFLGNQVIEQLKGIDFQKIIPVSNFVKPELGNPLKFKTDNFIPSLANIILTVTSFDALKKYKAICDFANAILEFLVENENWYWIIVGGGRNINGFKRELFDRAPDLCLRQVRTIGYYTPIWDAYYATDILIQMSYRVTLSNPLLEAQALGIPVLCNNFGGMPELVNKASIFDDKQGLKAKLNHILKSGNGTRLLDFGQYNIPTIDKYNRQNIGAQFKYAIEEILKNH